MISLLDLKPDRIVMALPGKEGWKITVEAVKRGIPVCLANKESLVIAGFFMGSGITSDRSRIIPVDSEHAALMQILARTPLDHIKKIYITASGGALRDMSIAEMLEADAMKALQHPVWNMGRKVTVDSASLTNKALEIIEAHWLFALPGEKIEPVVHPQSIVHAMVETRDGSVLAQMGAPDMRLPIQIALGYPNRVAPAAPRLAWAQMSRLEFEPVDRERFPAVDHAYRVLREGGTLGAVFNAANEAAVHAFLRGGLPFGAIEAAVADALDALPRSEVSSLDDVLDAEARTRAHAEAFLSARYGRAPISH